MPVSWGEEALSERVLRAVAARGATPAIYCACPTLRTRLLASGSELAPYLISVVAPSVATARYLRALQPDVPIRITVIGGCPGVRDPSIDSRVAPHDFLRLLASRGISPARQPAVFESIIPPDRRRHFSLPGGCPAPRALETRAPERRLVTITEDSFSAELAEYLLGGEHVLIDLSPRLACACCGGFGDGDFVGPAGREEILRHEPPRSPTPVLDHDVDVLLDHTATNLVSASAGAKRGGDRGSSREDDAEGLSLPGAEPIESLRQRAERRRIAVTPAAAMTPPAAPRRHATPTPSVAPGAATHIPAHTPAHAPAHAPGAVTG